MHKPASIKHTILILFAVLLAAACTLEKKTPLNRRLQNLTAHYNILFNARELLNQKQEVYAAAFIDDYSELLRVYPDTADAVEGDKELAAVIEKGNYIINFKEQSNYVGDAYLLLGKANYLGKQYFNAQEYCDYVLRSYREKPELLQEARVWKARSVMMLNQQEEAKPEIDTALRSINPKKDVTAHVYATALQYYIDARDYTNAEAMAIQAVEFANNSQYRARWRFILAQLQELNNKPADAVNTYTRIVHSNAPFEMAFNADLNRIRIEDMRDGVKISRVDRLRSLLRNSNNKEFTDQIYYHIAQIYYTEHNIDKAVENYRLAIAASGQNQQQKGLAYLRLADIYFKDKANYPDAKNYYDSTLANLSPTYPGYPAIRKKTDNLQQLTANLSIVAHEDTLQMLARLPEPARTNMVDSMVNRYLLLQQLSTQVTSSDPKSATAPTAVPLEISNMQNPRASTPTGGNFYFYNNAAVGSGFATFKQRWGNRKLEDNWRRSQRSTANLTVNNSQTTNPNAVQNQLQQTQNNTATADYRQQLLQTIPVNAAMVNQSNIRIYNALLEIANFYRDVIDDPKEAIATYELILKRFPGNPNRAAIYYSLYRLYTGTNQLARADEYKSRLLKEFADSPYARVILDPDYAKRINDADASFNALYNEVYELYAQRKYPEVMQQVDTLMQQYPNNKLSAQLQYLRALARGRQVKVDPFKADLQNIVNAYPADGLITPLVSQHLAFINANSNEMATRRFAILDSDPDYIPFAPEEVGPLVTEFATVADKRVEKTKVEKPVVVAKPADSPVVKKPEPEIAKQADIIQPKTDSVSAPVKPKKVYPFNESDSTNYYFVISVSSRTTNLASSRFGVGQFNRTRYQGVRIRHQLKQSGDNQLIYVGRFYTVGEAKEYARNIIPLMPEIMKVPKDKYTFFIITQQNLDKLADGKLLDTYKEYYQDNF